MEGGPKTTFDAKRRDLQTFLTYFGTTLRSDHVDDWTKSITKGFITWLESDANTGNAYSPTSINRILATLRHCCRWIQRRREFAAGHPFERIGDLDVDEPVRTSSPPHLAQKDRPEARRRVRRQ